MRERMRVADAATAAAEARATAAERQAHDVVAELDALRVERDAAHGAAARAAAEAAGEEYKEEEEEEGEEGEGKDGEGEGEGEGEGKDAGVAPGPEEVDARVSVFDAGDLVCSLWPAIGRACAGQGWGGGAQLGRMARDLFLACPPELRADPRAKLDHLLLSVGMNYPGSGMPLPSAGSLLGSPVGSPGGPPGQGGFGYPPALAPSPSGFSFADGKGGGMRGLMDQSSVLGSLPPPGQSRQGSALSIHSFGEKKRGASRGGGTRGGGDGKKPTTAGMLSSAGFPMGMGTAAEYTGAALGPVVPGGAGGAGAALGAGGALAGGGAGNARGGAPEYSGPAERARRNLRQRSETRDAREARMATRHRALLTALQAATNDFME